MSHFSTVAVNFTDRDALLAALQAMGFSPLVHQTAVQLQNSWGTATAEHKAEIIIPAEVLGSKADIGFAWRDDAWQLIADDYELDEHGQQHFKRELALNYALIQAQAAGYQVIREGNELIACPLQ